MVERNPEWPETCSIVVVTKETITDYGSYVKLNEHNKSRLLHISKISPAKISKSVSSNVKEAAGKEILEGKNSWFGNYANV